MMAQLVNRLPGFDRPCVLRVSMPLRCSYLQDEIAAFFRRDDTAGRNHCRAVGCRIDAKLVSLLAQGPIEASI
jgi:hypothetical protein